MPKASRMIRFALTCPPVNGIMRAGYLTSDPISTNVYCAEPNFNPDGSLQSDDFCLDLGRPRPLTAA